MGASRSVLMTSRRLAPLQPTMCWMAPLMPQAIYRSGAMRVPVWPTWSVCGRQPRLVTTREPPTAPSSSAANSSRSLKPSALPTPRPPPTTTRASASETLPALGSTRRATRTRRSVSLSVGVKGCISRGLALAAGSAARACGAAVSSLTAPFRWASSSRLPPQRWRVTR